MKLHRMDLKLSNTANEQGRVRAMLVGKHLSADLYTWEKRKCKIWWMPSVGILADVRVGRVECQIRWR